MNRDPFDRSNPPAADQLKYKNNKGHDEQNMDKIAHCCPAKSKAKSPED